jgi:hypothetical protein
MSRSRISPSPFASKRVVCISEAFFADERRKSDLQASFLVRDPRTKIRRMGSQGQGGDRGQCTRAVAGTVREPSFQVDVRDTIGV